MTLDDLRKALAAYDVTLDDVDEKDLAGDTIHGHGRTLVPVRGPGLGELNGVHVEVPIDVTITLDDRGRVRTVDHEPPAMDEIALTVRHIAAEDVPTHDVVTDDKGRRILQRKRFYGD